MRLFVPIMLIAPSLALADVPPPPLSPQQNAVALGLARALQSNSPASYFNALSDDVEVWIDGGKAASSKREWTAKFGPKLSTNGVSYRIDKVLAGNLNFVILSHFDSRGSFRLGNQECCELYEVAQYTVSNGKVTAIRVLTTGNEEVPLSLSR